MVQAGFFLVTLKVLALNQALNAFLQVSRLQPRHRPIRALKANVQDNGCNTYRYTAITDTICLFHMAWTKSVRGKDWCSRKRVTPASSHVSPDASGKPGL